MTCLRETTWIGATRRDVIKLTGIGAAAALALRTKPIFAQGELT